MSNVLLVARLMLIHTQTLKKEPDEFNSKCSAGRRVQLGKKIWIFWFGAPNASKMGPETE